MREVTVSEHQVFLTFPKGMFDGLRDVTLDWKQMDETNFRDLVLDTGNESTACKNL